MRVGASQTGAVAVSSDEDEDSDAEESLSDNIESSDEDVEMIDYENDITRQHLLPTEGKLYVIHSGRRFVNFNDE